MTSAPIQPIPLATVLPASQAMSSSNHTRLNLTGCAFLDQTPVPVQWNASHPEADVIVHFVVDTQHRPLWDGRVYQVDDNVNMTSEVGCSR